MIRTRNPGIQEAIRELKRMSMSNPVRLWNEAHLKEVRDRRAREAYVREEGKTEGKTEGKAEGLTEGEQRLSELIRRLIEDERLEEVSLAAEDTAARKRLYREYGIK